MTFPAGPTAQGTLGRAAGVIADLFGVMGLILVVPVVILAILSPFALFLGLLAWVRGG